MHTESKNEKLEHLSKELLSLSQLNDFTPLIEIERLHSHSSTATALIVKATACKITHFHLQNVQFSDGESFTHKVDR
jgi:hypothetical protein